MKKVIPIVVSMAIASSIASASVLTVYATKNSDNTELVETTAYVCVDISAPNNEDFLFVGQTLQLSATVTQLGTTSGVDQSVVWHSDNVAVADIDQVGFVNTHIPGTVTFSATSLIQVADAPEDVSTDTYTIVVRPVTSAGQFTITDSDYLPAGEIEPGIAITGFADESQMFNPILTIPSTINDKPVYEIKNSAFFDQNFIRQVNLPDSLVAIGPNAFADCDSLETINIPASLTTYDRTILQMDSSLKAINVHPDNAVLKSVDGVLFDITGEQLITYPAASAPTNYNIPTGVTTIRGSAFARAKNLVTLYIPDSVTTIETQAFVSTKALESVRLSPNATALPIAMFTYGQALRSITIPEGVISIDSLAFAYCPLLETVNFPSTLTAIMDECFLGCISLERLDLPEGLLLIGANAFTDCINLSTIVIPAALVLLGQLAFRNCQSLEVVNFPSSQLIIGSEVFLDCDSLSAINVTDDEPGYLRSSDGALYLETILLHYPAAKSGTSYTVSNGTTAMYMSAFTGAKNLETLTIPASVEEIVFGDISSATGLKAINVDIANSIYASTNGVLFSRDMTELLAYPAGKLGDTYTVPSTVSAIGDYAFNGSQLLQTINIANSVTTIGNSAFQALPNLVTLNIPDALLTAIGSDSIVDNPSLTTLAIPSSIESIGENSLVRNATLASFSMATAANQYFQVKDGVLYKHDSDEEILLVYPAMLPAEVFEIPNDTTEIASYAFYAVQSLASLSLPDEVEALPNYAITNNPHLSEIVINDNLENTSPLALYGNVALTTYTGGWANPVYDIFDGVLFSTEADSGLRTLVSYPAAKADTAYTVPEGVHVLDSYAFNNCINLQRIDLPYSLLTISDNTFDHCSNLGYLVIPRFVVMALSNAFANYHGNIFLEAETIPSGWMWDYNPDSAPIYPAGDWYYADNVPHISGEELPA